MGKPEGKRQLGRPTYRCEKNINIYSQGIGEDSVDCIGTNGVDCIGINGVDCIGTNGVDCIYLAQYWDKWQAFVSRVRKCGVSQNVGNRSIS